jgi:hypothetical protein
LRAGLFRDDAGVAPLGSKDTLPGFPEIVGEPSSLQGRLVGNFTTVSSGRLSSFTRSLRSAIREHAWTVTRVTGSLRIEGLRSAYRMSWAA